MLKIEQKKLTSNTNINKLLLSNASLIELLATLHNENLSKSITQSEIHHVVHNILHLDKQFHTLDTVAKIQLIGLGELIDCFEGTSDPDLRLALASRGYYLDQLTYDPNPSVRIHVARHKHNLDILMHDSDHDVRVNAIRAMIEEKKSHPNNHDLNS